MLAIRHAASLVTIVALLSTACGGSAKRSDDLLYDVRAFNEGLRWQKLPQAAVRIHPKEREAFLDEREQLQEELRIDDFEITRLKVTGDNQELASVQIKWTWHMDSVGLVHTTTSKQAWQRFGSRWLMLKEAHVRGDVMPGVPEDTNEQDIEDEASGDDVEAAGDAGASSLPQLNKALVNRSVEEALHAAQNPPKIAR